LTAEQHRDLLIRDAFVSGVHSPSIRQRLLESEDDDLDSLVKIAVTMELASEDAKNLAKLPAANPVLAASSNSRCCYWCGGKIHSKATCPAKNSICNNCSRRGHWATVCLSKPSRKSNDKIIPQTKGAVLQDRTRTHGENSDDENCASVFQLAATGEENRLIPVKVNDQNVQALLDTGSDKTFLSKDLANSLLIRCKLVRRSILLADNSRLQISGKAIVTVEWDGRIYDVEVNVVNSLVAPMVLGMDVLRRHKSVTLNFNKTRPYFDLHAVKEDELHSLQFITWN